jgi:CubicO group peptidase (beta-lactamase class C family)
MRQNHLAAGPLADFQQVHRDSWPWFEGYGYGLGVRTMVDRAAAGSNGSVGEFGWCGAAGTWIMVDLEEQLSACYMHQLLPVEKNLQDYCHPRVRNVIYGALD